MSERMKWATLREPVMRDPERRARVEAHERTMETIIELARLRADRGVTQVALARALDVSQASISKLERKAQNGRDFYLSTLSSYVMALGGELQLIAKFPDQEIPVPLIPAPPHETGADTAPMSPTKRRA